MVEVDWKVLESELAPTVVADVITDADALESAAEAAGAEEAEVALGLTADVIVVMLLDEFAVVALDAVDSADATELLEGEGRLLLAKSLERLVNKGKLDGRMVVDEVWLTDEVTIIETY